MKTKLALTAIAMMMSFNVWAQNPEAQRQMEIYETKQTMEVLFQQLETIQSEEQVFKIRLEIRKNFKKLDQLVLSGLNISQSGQ